MKDFLHLAVSPRYERSHSRQSANTFIKLFLTRHPDFNLREIDLSALHLPELDENFTNARYKASHGELLSASERGIWESIKEEFRRFNSADYYLFSLPMWNFSLPGTLKHYLDFITQPGVAFEIGEDGTYSGLLRGRRAGILYASGNLYEAPQMAPLDGVKRYLSIWGGFVGLQTDFFNAGGQNLKIDHEAREAALEQQLAQYINTLTFPD